MAQVPLTTCPVLQRESLGEFDLTLVSIYSEHTNVNRHREKARIHLQTDLADAITTSFRRLNALVNVDPEERFSEDPIKVQGSPHRLARAWWIDSHCPLSYIALEPPRDASISGKYQ